MKSWIANVVLVIAGAAWLATCLAAGFEKQMDIELSRVEGRR